VRKRGGVARLHLTSHHDLRYYKKKVTVITIVPSMFPFIAQGTLPRATSCLQWHRSALPRDSPREDHIRELARRRTKDDAAASPKGRDGRQLSAIVMLRCESSVVVSVASIVTSTL
jgi:hypothetical protein